jgi:ribonuclease D
MLSYAAEDTRHLPRLRDELLSALRALGRESWAQEEFVLMQQTRWSNGADPANAYLKAKGARELNPRQLAALRELHLWREATAEARDVAPFRVLSNEALLEIARALPRSASELAVVKGMSASLVERRGAELLTAVRRALQLSDRDLPTFPRGPRRPPPDNAFDARMERLRIARDKVADDLKLDRGFLMPRTQLEAIARLQPRTLEALSEVPEIRQWQIVALGEHLLTR